MADGSNDPLACLEATGDQVIGGSVTVLSHEWSLTGINDEVLMPTKSVFVRV